MRWHCTTGSISIVWHPCRRRLADQKPEGFVVIDVGAETTNVLFSFRNAIWFRSVRPAGDDLVSAFVHRFKLTRETAEQLACNPAKAKRLSDVHEEACQVYQKLAAQIEGCLTDFKKNVSARCRSGNAPGRRSRTDSRPAAIL